MPKSLCKLPRSGLRFGAVSHILILRRVDFFWLFEGNLSLLFGFGLLTWSWSCRVADDVMHLFVLDIIIVHAHDLMPHPFFIILIKPIEDLVDVGLDRFINAHVDLLFEK